MKKNHLLLKELEFVPIVEAAEVAKECEIPEDRERIKHKCKLCGDITGKDYARLLAYITSHYTSNVLL